jgi:hypothetical protein
MADVQMTRVFYVVAQTESWTLADNQTSRVQGVNTTPESITLADAVSSGNLLTAAGVESFNAADVASSVQAGSSSRQESFTVSDAGSAVNAVTVAIAETWTLADASSALMAAVASTPESSGKRNVRQWRTKSGAARRTPGPPPAQDRPQPSSMRYRRLNCDAECASRSKSIFQRLSGPNCRRLSGVNALACAESFSS